MKKVLIIAATSISLVGLGLAAIKLTKKVKKDSADEA